MPPPPRRLKRVCPPLCHAASAGLSLIVAIGSVDAISAAESTPATGGFDPAVRLDGGPADSGQTVPGGGWSRRAPETPRWSPPATAGPTEKPADGLPLDSRSRAVERADLAPVLAGDGSGLPAELWAGLDVSEVEKLIGLLTIPPRSPALHRLWLRLVSASVTPPSGAQDSGHFEALRLEALYRSGLLDEIDTELKKRAAAGPESPLVAMLAARSEIGLGRRESACRRARNLGDIRTTIPQSLRGEAVLVAGYCAAAEGNAPAAGLLAELAREEGRQSSPGLAALDAIAAGIKATPPSLAPPRKANAAPTKGKRGPDAPPPPSLSLVDYRILEIADAIPPAPETVTAATPALLVAISRDGAVPPELRLDAAEAAARLNAITPETLAAVYRSSVRGGAGAAPAANTTGASADGQDGPQRRAALFVAAEAERTPFKKVRLIRSALDSARRSGLYLPMLKLTAKLTADIGLAQEIGWFAETAIEANLAAGDFSRARTWTKFAGSLGDGAGGARSGYGHWMALIDIADPDFPDPRGSALGTVETMALSGRFSTDLLHRLATVLDALQYNVPIPLWEAASRTPQPADGHLPPTGVLSQLQQAAAKREFGRTVLLVMQTLGPDGADRAHMIALGDSIRALKRAGLEADARNLALEALLGAWPRSVSN